MWLKNTRDDFIFPPNHMTWQTTSAKPLKKVSRHEILNEYLILGKLAKTVENSMHTNLCYYFKFIQDTQLWTKQYSESYVYYARSKMQCVEFSTRNGPMNWLKGDRYLTEAQQTERKASNKQQIRSQEYTWYFWYSCFPVSMGDFSYCISCISASCSGIHNTIQYNLIGNCKPEYK